MFTFLIFVILSTVYSKKYSDYENSKILQFLGMKSEFNHSANHWYQKLMTFGRKNTSLMIGIARELLTIEIFAIVLIKRNVKIIIS